MRRHQHEETRLPLPRYHTQGADGLYAPIRFAFVTARMHQDIMAERALLLACVAPAASERQARLFAAYDPGRSAQAFGSLLALFRLDSVA